MSNRSQIYEERGVKIFFDEGSKLWTATYRQPGIGTYTLTAHSRHRVTVKLNLDLGIKNTNLGRPKGVKNFAGRPYNQSDIKRMFESFGAAIRTSAFAAKAITMEEVANELLERAVRNAEYDEYTGNLTASYSAVIVNKRKITRTIMYREKVGLEYGDVLHGPQGGRYVYRRKAQHHKSASKRRAFKIKTGDGKGADIRYLRKWEKESGGYGAKFNAGYGKSARFNAGYLNRGSGRTQSGVLITNDAPYASAVHRTSGRTVLKGSSAVSAIRGKWGSQYQSLVRFASNKMIRELNKSLRMK